MLGRIVARHRGALVHGAPLSSLPYLLVTENGTVFAGSWDTPFDLPDGRSTRCEQMLGELVATDDGPGTPIAWEPRRSVHQPGLTRGHGHRPRRQDLCVWREGRQACLQPQFARHEGSIIGRSPASQKRVKARRM
jgi:hypothetical protein